MQIRKCVLLEMFSFVLIGMFSPFFHIIGSRIGTCLFRKDCFHFSMEIPGTISETRDHGLKTACQRDVNVT